MRAVVTAAEMRALDRATIEDIGIPAFTLMETAGRAVAHVAMEMFEAPGHIAVVCGPGNNGGDGFVAARGLRDLGHDAVLYPAVPRSSVKGAAAPPPALPQGAGGLVRMIDTPRALGELAPALEGAVLAIDALFGVGLARPVDGHLADVVAAINAAPLRLAVDIPSGLDADTGRVLGTCVEADATVTMAALKIALASAPGFAHCGTIDVADIGVPSGVLATQAVHAGIVEEADVASWLPRADVMDPQGSRGHVLNTGRLPGHPGSGPPRARVEAPLRVRPRPHGRVAPEGGGCGPGLR